MPSRLSAGKGHLLDEQVRSVGGIHAELLQLAAAAEAGRVVGFDDHQRGALGALFGIGLGDDDDEIGVLSIGDEGFEPLTTNVARSLRGRAHALQVGARAGLTHGDGANEFAGGELRQPAPLLLLGAVTQDVWRDDARMQRRAERIEAGERIFAVDHRLVRESAAAAAIFLRHRGAEEAGRAGLSPYLTGIKVVLVPLFKMGDELGGDKAPRLLFEQDDVLGHPCRAREIKNIGHSVPPLSSR